MGGKKKNPICLCSKHSRFSRGSDEKMLFCSDFTNRYKVLVFLFFIQNPKQPQEARHQLLSILSILKTPNTRLQPRHSPHPNFRPTSLNFLKIDHRFKHKAKTIKHLEIKYRKVFLCPWRGRIFLDKIRKALTIKKYWQIDLHQNEKLLLIKRHHWITSVSEPETGRKY